MTTQQGRRNNPYQVPGPGQTKSGARYSAGLKYIYLYRADQERTLRSESSGTVHVGREHATCSMDATEEIGTEHRAESLLGWLSR